MNSKIPDPQRNETPTQYADRLGTWYASQVSADHKKRFAQYFTPESVANHMASLFGSHTGEVRLLDPGAGTGILTCAVGEHLASMKDKPARFEVELYENDLDLVSILKESLSFLERHLVSTGMCCKLTIRTDDFVLTHAQALSGELADSPSLFYSQDKELGFDIAISNPPYFKIPKSDPRSIAASTVIHGQPNIYALFMAVSAAVLKPGGQLVFITPRSYASGPYFRLFREIFFSKMRLESIHVFESRTEAFKRDNVLQENIIIKAQKQDLTGTERGRGHVWISVIGDSGDVAHSKCRKMRSDVLLEMSSVDKVLHIPTTDQELAVMETVRSWPGSLRKYGLEISTGPVVPFRAVPWLNQEGEVPSTHAPLLWMQHVRPMKVQWPIPDNRKPQFIQTSDAARKLLVPSRNYVLIRRFSAKEEKRRLVAAPCLRDHFESAWLGLENHLNYIHKPGGELTEDEIWGLSVLYNSSILDTYFRTLNGNTQVSATELRGMPLPDRQVIVQLGQMAKDIRTPAQNIDGLMETVLSTSRGPGDRERAFSVPTASVGGVWKG